LRRSCRFVLLGWQPNYGDTLPIVARWTGQGHDRHRTPDYHVRPEADSVLDAASATTSRVDAEELGGVMTEKLAELFAESATEEHALRPVRRRRLDS